MQLSELIKGYETRTPEEALSEVERELNVREKCFVRWIGEGRMTKVDARDRLQRLRMAFELLAGFIIRTEAIASESGADLSTFYAETRKHAEKKSDKPVDGAEPF